MDLLVTNHAHVLAHLARDPNARLRDVAQSTALTERAVQRIVADLEENGFLRRVREGRRNRYELDPEPLLRVAHSLAALAGHDLPVAPPVDAHALSPTDAHASPGVDVHTFPPAQGDGISRHLSFID